MEVTESKVDGLSREFKIAVPAADVEEKIISRLKKLAQSARIPGFRPGKVPVQLLRRRYGDAVKGEVLEQAVQESSASVVSERGLRCIGEPKIEVTSFEDGGNLEYTLAVDLFPEFELPDFSKIQLERLVVNADEEEVDKTLERLADVHKTSIPLTEARPARAGDTVVMDFVGRVDGEKFDGGAAEGFQLELGSGRFIPGFEDQLVGASAGEERSVVVTFPENYGEATLAGKEAIFEVKVNEIHETVPAVIDDEFAKKFGMDSLSVLKQQIRDSHAEEFKKLSRMKLKRVLLDRLAEMHDFELPSGIVDREFQNIVQQFKAEKAGTGSGQNHEHDHDHDHDHEHDHDHRHDHDHGHEHEKADADLTDEQRTEYRGLAERRVRLGVLLAEIGRVNNLRVTDDELTRAMYAEAQRFPGQEQMVFEYFRKEPKAKEALAAPVLEDKVVDFILEMAAVTDRNVSANEIVEEDADAEEESN